MTTMQRSRIWLSKSNGNGVARLRYGVPGVSYETLGTIWKGGDGLWHAEALDFNSHTTHLRRRDATVRLVKIAGIA